MKSIISTLPVMDIFTELDIAFQQMLLKSEQERLRIHSEFAIFYYNDYESIVSLLKKATLNKPFSQKTIDNITFQHVDIISKALNRIVSGIYTQRPVREFQEGTPEENDLLESIITGCSYNRSVRDVFRKATYFNIAFAMPVFTGTGMRIDVITPENVVVKTKKDYLQLKEIAIKRCDENKQIYYEVWTESEYYIIQSGSNAKLPVGNNDSIINPFGKIPISILRMKEGIDFYGEPNWNLFLNQKNYDIRLTDLNWSELMSIHQIWFGIDTNFPEGMQFTPGIIAQAKAQIGANPPSLSSVSADINYTALRENIDWRMKQMLISEGISASSASTELVAQSGAAKTIDEIELNERRDETKELLYDFEIDLLNNLRMIYNFYSPKDNLTETKTFNIIFNESKSYESIQDKIARREMELKYNLKNITDFAMEDFEISELEAQELIAKNYLANTNIQITDE